MGPGFVGPSAPAPEATVKPQPGSWAGVHPSKDYRVVLLTAGDDGPTKSLVAAVKDWAEDEHVDLRTIVVGNPNDAVPSITKAMDLGPDLIVSAGNELIDALALVTPNHLAQQFLVVGAELAEPTHNVTSVDWSGASFRGEGSACPRRTTPRRSRPSAARTPSGRCRGRTQRPHRDRALVGLNQGPPGAFSAAVPSTRG
ncbi:hypothetical protein GCM10027614_51150 [Micromonospora vulcania]